MTPAPADDAIAAAICQAIGDCEASTASIAERLEGFLGYPVLTARVLAELEALEDDGFVRRSIVWRRVRGAQLPASMWRWRREAGEAA